MTIQGKLASFLAAGMLVGSVAAHAQNATAPDPNIGPSAEVEEATLPHSNPNSPELARDPDPDEGPTIAGEEAELPPSPPNSPQLATDPDPDIARSDDMIGQ